MMSFYSRLYVDIVGSSMIFGAISSLVLPEFTICLGIIGGFIGAIIAFL